MKMSSAQRPFAAGRKWPNHAMQLTPSARHASCLAYQPQESRHAPGVADLLPLGVATTRLVNPDFYKSRFLSKRQIIGLLNFATGFVNTATVIPLLLVLPVILYNALQSPQRKPRLPDSFYVSGVASGTLDSDGTLRSWGLFGKLQAALFEFPASALPTSKSNHDA
jgi:hypothetical protein